MRKQATGYRLQAAGLLLLMLLAAPAVAGLPAAQAHPAGEAKSPQAGKEKEAPGKEAAGKETGRETAGKEAAGKEAHEGKAEKEENPREMIWKIVNFLLFFGGLGYFLRKPAGDFFAGRTRSIQQGMAEAREAREKAEKRLGEIEQRLGRLGDEISALRAEAAREGAAQDERMRKAAQEEAAKILAAAESEIDTLARAARLDLKSYTAQLAVQLAEERIRGEMNPEAQGRLLRSYVADLNSPGKSGGGN